MAAMLQTFSLDQETITKIEEMMAVKDMGKSELVRWLVQQEYQRIHEGQPKPETV